MGVNAAATEPATVVCTRLSVRFVFHAPTETNRSSATTNAKPRSVSSNSGASLHNIPKRGNEMSELTYDIEEYRSNLLTTQKSYREHTRTFFLIAVVTFCVGAVLLYLNMTVVAVVFLVLCLFFHQGSNYHHLLADMLDTH